MASKTAGVKETVKEKVAVAQAEVMEALETAKVNLTMAVEVVKHPFDKEKHAQAKEEAAMMKQEVAAEKQAKLEEAHQKKAQALGIASHSGTAGTDAVQSQQPGVATSQSTPKRHPYRHPTDSLKIGRAGRREGGAPMASSVEASQTNSASVTPSAAGAAGASTALTGEGAGDQAQAPGEGVKTPQDSKVPFDPTKPIFMTGA